MQRIYTGQFSVYLVVAPDIILIFRGTSYFVFMTCVLTCVKQAKTAAVVLGAATIPGAAAVATAERSF